MTMIDCIALGLTLAAVWLACELYWACQRRNNKGDGK